MLKIVRIMHKKLSKYRNLCYKYIQIRRSVQAIYAVQEKVSVRKPSDCGKNKVRKENERCENEWFLCCCAS